MDTVAAEGQERDPMRWLVIGGVITIVVSTAGFWAWLPEPMAAVGTAVMWSLQRKLEE